MEKIWIFGDSYSARWFQNEYEYTWPRKLEKKYHVENFSFSGTGPEYQLNLLKNQVIKLKNANELKNINLIFFMSGNERINFTFLDDIMDQNFMVRICADRPNLYNDPKVFQKYLHYKRYRNFITYFFRYYFFNKDNEIDILKTLSFVKDISNIFKKVLLIPVFDDLKNKNIFPFYNYMLQNDTRITNFYIAAGQPINMIDKNMDEPNHIEAENHSIMVDMFVDWIENNVNLDSSKLKKSR